MRICVSADSENLIVLHKCPIIPCIKSGTFMRYHPQSGQRHNSGGVLWPANGCARVARATAVRTKSSSRRLGFGLVSAHLRKHI